VNLAVVSPFPEWAWPLVWAWTQTFRDRVMDDFSPPTCAHFLLQMNRARPEDTYAVYRDEDLGGLVWLPRVSPIVAFSHVVYSRSFWGHATTLQATRQAYAAAFDAGVLKICSSSFVDNHQVRAFAKALGFREEGRRRQQTQRRGKLVDMLDYGLLKEDFYANWNTGRHADLDGNKRRGGPRFEPAQPLEDLDQHADVHGPAEGDAEAGRRHPVCETGGPRGCLPAGADASDR
jgi:RimJ/RimL family protein N-acetyltransferase